MKLQAWAIQSQAIKLQAMKVVAECLLMDITKYLMDI